MVWTEIGKELKTIVETIVASHMYGSFFLCFYSIN